MRADTRDGVPALFVTAPWVEDGKLYNALIALDKGRPTMVRSRLDKSIPVWSFAAVYAQADDSFVILN